MLKPRVDGQNLCWDSQNTGIFTIFIKATSDHPEKSLSNYFPRAKKKEEVAPWNQICIRHGGHKIFVGQRLEAIDSTWMIGSLAQAE